MGNKPSSNNASGKCIQELTIGVELEFYACLPKIWNEDNVIRVQKMLAQPIPIKCKNPRCGKMHDLRLPIKSPQDSEGPVYDQDYSGWGLSYDNSVHLDTDTELVGMDPNSDLETAHSNMELVSRVMNFQGTTPCPFGQRLPCNNELVTYEWREEIAGFMTALTRGFNSPGHRLLIPNSAGMHVHVGRGDQGFKIPTIQGAMGTFIAFERLFDSILPTQRISGYSQIKYRPFPHDMALPGLDTTHWKHNYPSESDYEEMMETAGNYCQPMSSEMFFRGTYEFLSKLGSATTPPNKLTEALRTLNVPSWLDILEYDVPVPSPSDTDEPISQEVAQANRLSRYYTPHHSVVNLENLTQFDTDAETPLKNTIEFRSHAATLDIEEIAAWVDFVCKLTAFCFGGKTKVFKSLREQWAIPDYRFTDLAKHMGCTETTVNHYASVLTKDYAVNRFFRQIQPPSNPYDDLFALTLAIEWNRLRTSLQSAVQSKIRYKLDSGRYGQLPRPLLEAMMGDSNANGLDTRRGGFMDLNTCDFEDWVRLQRELVHAPATWN